MARLLFDARSAPTALPGMRPLSSCDRKACFLDETATPRAADLEDELAGKRKLWLLLNPGRAFRGAVVLLAPQKIPISTLTPWLSAVQRAGFSSVGTYLRAPPLDLPTGMRIPVHLSACSAWT